MKVFTTSKAKRGFSLFIGLLFLSSYCFSQILVTGRITTENGGAFSGFGVLATGTETKIAFTDANGNYSLSLQAGGSYEITPLDCNENPLNGVTTYDLVLINKHFAGVEPFSSPYKIIAADADNSGVVDTLDYIVLRNLIMGIIIDLPGGNIKYVLKDYVFPNPMEPFSPPYPSSFLIPNLQTNIANVDFIGMKVGDVNTTSVLTEECNAVNLPDRITGKVFRDLDLDCQYDAGEPALSGWQVSASNGSSSFYATTNTSGAYEMNVLPGTYEVILTKPNGLWDACSDTIPNVLASLSGGSPADFGVQAIELCPALEVDLSMWGLRRCFSNAYTVQYCNFGTSQAENAYVEVELDPFFIFETSSVPATNIGGNTYSFYIGDVASGYCGKFNVRFTLSCDATLGQTHCSEARIFPDTICNSPEAWTGPDLQVDGVCNGSDAIFTISNHGSNMLEPSSYIVIEDIVVMMPPIQNPFSLPSGGSEVITIPANGKTVRLEVDQPAGHPWSDKASATVEGCGTNANGTFSMGMVNLFPMNDQSPVVDIDCRENTGSFDPNDKQGMPFGVKSEHFIPLDQPIEYMIRFQNTGTDTAFTVIVRDTLDPELNINSIRPLGSSHPYTFNLSGQGVAQFVFTNIMLPDSNINEVASHGFVKFTITPKANLAEGTNIENKAAIYFDFNEPVITNTTWHTLGIRYLLESNVLFDPEIGLEVFPNPTTDAVNFTLKSPVPLHGLLEILDVNGKQLAIQNFENNNFIFNAQGLMPGYYAFKIHSKGRVLAAGKLIKVE